MEKGEIIKRFQKNGYDEKTIDMLVEAIEDFKEIELDKYVPISEVVERICRNLKNGIEYKKINDNVLGNYSNENSKIILNEDAIKNEEE